MYKAGSKTRRSLNRPLDKENIAEALNNQPREKQHGSIPNLLMGHSFMSVEEKPLRKLGRKGIELGSSQQSMDSLPTVRPAAELPVQPEFLINELENVQLLGDYSLDFLKGLLGSCGPA